ncbi:CDP-alcohol phosphatidyltransferase family protein [Gardnerella greenwoodii]|uniref:Phosphatidylinositol phosphate synthase n=1 Tax=Gardnerella greenwoodii TaxID=2914925 RepID=A0A2N6RXV8_9BIFI|nr:CDP-alcohol phosphatidyltransferase family protein [Gardnerella greenwoodii]MDF0753118.1 CDP-alcohol phosphatidyltransferase family protein [Gardnerella greenwoodii]PMC42863.1 CDP-alcohol phosphatidyltransferase family protein [Gardnerella greenwoodii]
MLESLRSSFKRVIAPVAKLFVRLGVSANAVTIVGTLAVVVISFVTAFTGQLFAGAILLTIFVLADGLDGSVAALTTGGTKFGAFLDSTLDRIADWSLFMAVFICLWRANNKSVCMWIPSVIGMLLKYAGLFTCMIALMAAFVTSYTRARGQSISVDPKSGLITRADRVAIILVAIGLSGITNQLFWLSCAMILLSIGGIVTVIQRILEVKQGLQQKDK